MLQLCFSAYLQTLLLLLSKSLHFSFFSDTNISQWPFNHIVLGPPKRLLNFVLNIAKLMIILKILSIQKLKVSLSFSL